MWRLTCSALIAGDVCGHLAFPQLPHGDALKGLYYGNAACVTALWRRNQELGARGLPQRLLGPLDVLCGSQATEDL